MYLHIHHHLIDHWLVPSTCQAVLHFYLCVRLGSFSMFLFHHLSTLNALLPELQRAASTFICERCVWSVSAVSCRLVFVHGTVTTCRLWSGGHSQWSLTSRSVIVMTHSSFRNDSVTSWEIANTARYTIATMFHCCGDTGHVTVQFHGYFDQKYVRPWRRVAQPLSSLNMFASRTTVYQLI